MDTNKMMAQVFHEPKKICLERIDIPQIGQDEMLIEVKNCGVCGSDIAYYYGRSPLETETGKGPLVLGHEFAGKVVHLGSLVKKQDFFEEGDRVVVNPVQYCNTCRFCNRGYVNVCENKTVLGVSTNGAFAQYTKCKYWTAYKLPSQVGFEEAALSEPLACSIYAISNLDVRPGNFCTVIGPGPIGLMMIQLIKRRGAGKVILVGTRDYRLEMGKRIGADIIVNTADKNSAHYAGNLPKMIEEVSGGMMADRVVISTGSAEAFHEALRISGPKSIIVYFGVPGENDFLSIPALSTLLHDKTVRFSWLAPFTWTEAIQCLANEIVSVRPLITHRLNLTELVKGVEAIEQRQDQAFKALVGCKVE